MRIALFVLMMIAAVAHADPDLVIIVNADNAVKLSPDYLEGVFLKKEKFFSGDVPIVALNAAPDSALRQEFDRIVLNLTPEQSARYWIDARVRSGETPPKELADSALTVKLVAKLKGGIGYVPVTTQLSGVRVVGQIKAGKLVLP
ncbi:MAG: hypothetical protein QM831_26675 [Kofleriaceae bacterium]